VKILAAAVQMASPLYRVSENVERADEHLKRARLAGAELAVLPEMFNTGYARCPDYGPYGESPDGPTLTHLRHRAMRWNMTIAAGFVESHDHHLYDSLAVLTPDGQTHVYRKRNLVFWERSRFRPGRDPLVVATRWGRIGLAICADMIYRKVWSGYRDRIDLAVVASAWPEFTNRETGRRHWLLGHVGPLSGEIPGKVAADLGVPVVFANQCGETRTFVPLLQTTFPDRFAGRSSVCDGRHGAPVVAGTDEEVVLSPLTLHSPRGVKTWRFTSRSVPAA
jgi:N-carbamoylputrescine amidase